MWIRGDLIPLLSLVSALGACVSSSGEPERAAAKPAASTPVWCPAAKGFSADPATDRTGRDNDFAHVMDVLSAHHAEIWACPGVTMTGITATPIMDAVRSGRDPTSGPISQDAKTHAIKISVRSEQDLPAVNPIYLDGVRVYFEIGEIVPL